ncbi:hypothetical protein [Actinoplanes awajinensis]|nr:hypothetical protein [Actinoplanes awajinensis]
MKALLPIEERPRVDSLPSDQVRLLLHTMRLHRSLLEAAHQDAKRLATDGVHPCYLIDYQLLHRFIYDQGRTPESLVEFWYLLEQQDITLIVGHGTFIEVLHRVQRSTKIHLPRVAGIESYEHFVNRLGVLSSFYDFHELLDTLIRKDRHHARAIKRLADVLQRKNIEYIWDLGASAGETLLDQNTYVNALDVLSSIRPSRKSVYPNAADAMNIADVAGLRSMSERGAYPGYCFMLTDTRPLLDERNWARDPHMDRTGYASAVSRTPVAAIYSHLVLPSDGAAAGQVADNTVRLMYDAAKIEKELRSSAGYRGPISMGNDRWEDIAAEGRVTPELIQQLGLLSRFVGDPVIAETQRMYDNSRRAMAIWSAQYGDRQAVESPLRLFDVILSLSRVLGQQDRPLSDLASFWQSVIERSADHAGDWWTLTYQRRGEGPDGVPYLEVERHRDFAIVRWPSSASLENVLAAFAAIFARHGIKHVVLLLGMECDVIKFDAELPVTPEEFQAGIREAEDGFARDGLGKPLWLRMNAEPFDLYADLFPSQPGLDPVLGICGTGLDFLHIRELYQATAQRFLFDSWFDAVLADAARDEWRP